MKWIKNRKTLIIAGIILSVLLISGGTYAFLLYGVNITNGNYVANTGCFDITYNINNSNGTQDISGIIFPSVDATSGINGRVTLGVSSSCDVIGFGKLYLHVNSDVDSTLVQTVAAHCEEPVLLEH